MTSRTVQWVAHRYSSLKTSSIEDKIRVFVKRMDDLGFIRRTPAVEYEKADFLLELRKPGLYLVSGAGKVSNWSDDYKPWLFRFKDAVKNPPAIPE